MGVNEPNKVQVEALALALSGKDVSVCSWTGSGKTLMFLLPILQSLAADESAEAVVLAPTPELADQIADIAKQLSAPLPSPPAIATVLPDGGEGSDARLLVATPAPLLSLIERRTVATTKLRIVAIDEADALCEAAEDAKSADGAAAAAILDALASPQTGSGDNSTSPQIILTMATLSAEAEGRWIRDRFPNAHRVSHAGVLPPTLKQRFQLIPYGEKGPHLMEMLRSAAADEWLSAGGTMIFCSEASLAAHVHALVCSEQVLLPPCPPSPPSSASSVSHRDDSPPTPTSTAALLPPALLTADTPSRERSATIRAVRDGRVSILVCTDVASRGLDFPTMRHVIMYDLPSGTAKFIHRAGRTARVGREGQVSVLVEAREAAQYRALHEGEALPGTALHRAGGRTGVAMPHERARPAQQRGWLATGDLGHAERSFGMTPQAATTSSDFASAVPQNRRTPRDRGLGGVADGGDTAPPTVFVYAHGEDDDDPRLRGPEPDRAQRWGRLKG